MTAAWTEQRFAELDIDDGYGADYVEKQKKVPEPTQITVQDAAYDATYTGYVSTGTQQQLEQMYRQELRPGTANNDINNLYRAMSGGSGTYNNNMAGQYLNPFYQGGRGASPNQTYGESVQSDYDAVTDEYVTVYSDGAGRTRTVRTPSSQRANYYAQQFMGNKVYSTR